MSLLAGGAANVSYSADNRDTIDDYEDRCRNEYYTVLSAFQDVCDDLPRVRDAEAASAVSYYRVLPVYTITHIVMLYIANRPRWKTFMVCRTKL